VRFTVLAIISASFVTTAAAQRAVPSFGRRPLTDSSVAQDAPSPTRLVRAHRALGTTALATFGTALVIGAASGNLGKLMDPADCCPDGGTRDATWRTVDRALVNIGILSYLGAAGLGIRRARASSSADESPRRRAHRRLAMAHGAVFATSLVTGVMMSGAQETDPDKFARVARVHVAANVALVPLLAAAFTSVTVRD